MKLNAALAKTLLMAASIGMVVPVVADTPARGKADKAKPAPAPAPADPAEPTIPGVVIARPKGGFLGLQIVDGNFKLSFYDEKKKPIAVDVDRATARWSPKYKPTDEHKVLVKSDDGLALVSPNIRPPYNFKLFLTLLSADDQIVESHTVDVRE